MNKRVAVIGAGLSGLVTVKELLEEHHHVTCFEKNHDIGGVFTEKGSYESVELTVSNYFMAFSDFMPFDEEIKFWTRGEYKTYLARYAENYGLRSHIRFQTIVEKISEINDQFEISYSDPSGIKSSQVFDNIVICSGQFQKPNIPEIAGLETFTGPKLHSTDYVNAEQCRDLKGKRILCLGVGESGADIVTEISNIADKTVLSIRRNHLFSTKMVGPNKTIDMVQTRFWHSIPAQEKASSVRKLWRNMLNRSTPIPIKLLAKHVIDAPDEPGSVVTKTERIFDAVAAGMEIDVGGIQHISGNTVCFNSGRVEDFDAIVFCTGFKFHLPFLPEIQQFDNIRDCYLHSFHPLLRERISFVGFARPQQGGVPLIAELQARYLALVLSGKKVLPENLQELAARDKAIWQHEFYETPHVFGLVNGLRFNEQIAELIGCRPLPPNIFTSPFQFLVFWFHHVWPCQFRLRGPGARKIAQQNWTKAPSIYPLHRKFILTLGLFYKWMTTKNKSDYKLKWRPIFKSDNQN